MTITWAALFCSLIACSCSLENKIPTVADEALEALVNTEAGRIIEVSEDREAVLDYRIYLSDFPRQDILGLSIGQRRIYVSYTLARLAMHHRWYRWLLRQTLAHEVAHQTAGHANSNSGIVFNGSSSGNGIVQTDVGLASNVKFRNYSYSSELEADFKAMGYWHKLGWSCSIWVRILESFMEQKYAGDVLHPTLDRLQQAQNGCRPAGLPGGTTNSPSLKSLAINSPQNGISK